MGDFSFVYQPPKWEVEGLKIKGIGQILQPFQLFHPFLQRLYLRLRITLFLPLQLKNICRSIFYKTLVVKLFHDIDQESPVIIKFFLHLCNLTFNIQLAGEWYKIFSCPYQK